MRSGDLSNELGYIVGIRYEAVLYNFGKVNQPGKAFLENLFQTSCNIYLLTLLDERKAKAWCYKWGCPYTQLIQAESLLEIPEICVANKMLAYYDTDDRVLEAVRARGNPRTEAIKWNQDGFESRITNETS